MSDKPTIETRENGPLIVKNLDNFRLPDDSRAEPKPLIALCRCGASKNKPYCDGSHKDAGFDGSSNDVTDRDRIYTYEGNDITVHYNKLLCSHAGECVRRAASVFNPKQTPWVQPDAGTPDQIKDVVAACPSGALRYATSGDPVEITTKEIAVTTEKNGPYHVTNIPLQCNYWAKGQSTRKYVLCRCGMSKNKPFCDGTHQDEEWTDQV